MKQNTYKVWFTNGTYEPQYELVGGFNDRQAEIVAQAVRIRAGLDYTTHKVEVIE